MNSLNRSFLCLVLSLFATSAVGSQTWPHDPRRDLNTLVGEDPPRLPLAFPHQAEPHLARSPVNPDILFAVWQDGRYANGGAVGIGYAVSTDGGYSWERSLIPGLTQVLDGPYNRGTDPVAAIDANGRLYLNALVSTEGVFDVGAIILMWSDDLGQTWSDPVEVFRSAEPFPDKNWMALNTYEDSPTSGRIAITWTNFYEDGRFIIALTLSDDGGLTWTPVNEITTHRAQVQGSLPVFFAEGALGVAYHGFNTSLSGQLEFRYSADGGASFDEPRVVQPYELYQDPILRHGRFLPSIAADTNGTIYLSYGELIDDTGIIRFTKSTDRGVSWSSPVQVSDNLGQVPAVSPTIAAAPDGSHLVVTYYEKAGSSGGAAFEAELRAAMSFDEGTSWKPSIRLSDDFMDVSGGALVNGGLYMLGDYFGLVPSGGVRSGIPAVALWIDTRGADADPYTVRLTPWDTTDYWAWENVRFGPFGERELAWFGTFWQISFPWHFHETHQWIYSESPHPDAVVFYDPGLGYWWTSESAYPWLFSYKRTAWLYYEKGTSQPRRFYNASLRQWLSIGE
jgi:hypothetical protein